MPKKKLREKSLVGYITKSWLKDFRFMRKACIANIPDLLRYPKGKFFFSQYRKVKVRIIIQELGGK